MDEKVLLALISVFLGIIEKAKTLSGEEFEKTYRPEDFVRKTVPDPTESP